MQWQCNAMQQAITWHVCNILIQMNCLRISNRFIFNMILVKNELMVGTDGNRMWRKETIKTENSLANIYLVPEWRMAECAKSEKCSWYSNESLCKRVAGQTNGRSETGITIEFTSFRWHYYAWEKQRADWDEPGIGEREAPKCRKTSANKAKTEYLCMDRRTVSKIM